MENKESFTSIPPRCPTAGADRNNAASRLPTVRIHSIQRRFAFGHLLATRQRFCSRALHLFRDLELQLAKSLCRHAFFLQVLLVEPNGIALAPALEQLRRKRLPRLALVMRRVPTHAERFGNQQRWAVALTTPLGGDACGRVSIQHIVAVERGAPDALACRPILAISREMGLLEPPA